MNGRWVEPGPVRGWSQVRRGGAECAAEGLGVRPMGKWLVQTAARDDVIGPLVEHVVPFLAVSFVVLFPLWPLLWLATHSTYCQLMLVTLSSCSQPFLTGCVASFGTGLDVSFFFKIK